MFNYHYDHQSKQWNVFDKNGYYVCSFLSAQEARDFCNASNSQ